MMLAVLAAAGSLAAAQAEIDKLSWMAGVWTAKSGESTLQVTWLPPLNGAMASVNQTSAPGQPTRQEFITITADAQGVAFTPFTASEKLGVFRKQPGPDGEAIFENPASDFPRRVIYRRCGADLCTRLEGVVKGKPAALDTHYTRLLP